MAAKTLAVVDFSWCCYLNRFRYPFYGYPSLRPEFPNIPGDSDPSHFFLRPTGHIFGTVQSILQLAQTYSLVVLAVDSFSRWRKDLLPGYKAGRHEPTGDPTQDFPIRTDFDSILGLCTFPKNVLFIKRDRDDLPDGLEADDLIASFIYATRSPSEYYDAFPIKDFDLSVYAVDADLLQIPGDYLWFRNFNEPPTDRRQYIFNKFKIDLPYLPHIYKVIRGDPSDNIPPAVPRLPTKVIQSICASLDPVYTRLYEPPTLSAKAYADSILKHSQSVGGKTRALIDSLFDPESESFKALSVNQAVTTPYIFAPCTSDLKRMRWDLSKVQSVCDSYSLSQLSPLLARYA